MASDVRRFLAWTDLGDAAADFDARMLALGVDLPTDEGDGRMYLMYTDENRAASDLEARLAALGADPVVNTGVAERRYYAFTRLGENAADLERRLALATGQLGGE
jgi:hypothetical protein